MISTVDSEFWSQVSGLLGLFWPTQLLFYLLFFYLCLLDLELDAMDIFLYPFDFLLNA